jgi:hypothetical protein
VDRATGPNTPPGEYENELGSVDVEEEGKEERKEGLL